MQSHAIGHPNDIFMRRNTPCRLRHTFTSMTSRRIAQCIRKASVLQHKPKGTFLLPSFGQRGLDISAQGLQLPRLLGSSRSKGEQRSCRPQDGGCGKLCVAAFERPLKCCWHFGQQLRTLIYLSVPDYSHFRSTASCGCVVAGWESQAKQHFTETTAAAQEAPACHS